MISPDVTEDSQKAVKNQTKQRRRIQAKCEVLTEEDCMERLRQEEESRNAKSATSKGKKGKSGIVKSSEPKAKPTSTEVKKTAAKPKTASLKIPNLRKKSSDPDNLVKS